MLMMMKSAGAHAQMRESEISTNELRLNFESGLEGGETGTQPYFDLSEQAARSNRSAQG
jgi:hypothetical protein